MSKRRSIYIGAELQRVLDARGASEPESSMLGSVSGIINAIADRYEATVRYSMPRLTVAEWCLIWDVLNGVWMADTAGLYVRGVLLEVHDVIRLNRLDEKWEVDGPALEAKLQNMSFANLIAIVDTAERFWARGNDGREYGEIVTEICGAGAIEAPQEQGEK